MTYEQFLQEIYVKKAGKAKLTLARIEKFLDAVGNPQAKLNGINVAGTNGKGSVCAIVESILVAHGFKTGLNTSPHLVNYTERFRLNKKSIKPDILKTYYEKFKTLHEKFNTTYFEITTAIAFQLFLDEKTDYAIMEVGMGGRLDATKLVNSVITAITNIDLDHTKALGNTIPKIAHEKAGILKENIPVILGKMKPIARRELTKAAKNKNCPILDFEDEIKIDNEELRENGCSYDIAIPHYKINYENIFCNLVGYHQVLNSAQALLIVANLAKRFNWDLEEKKVKAGMKSVSWQGRMQQIDKNPTILIDGAHNPGGIEQLVYNLQNLYEYKKLFAVIAILYDKDFKRMIKNLSPIVDTFVVCKSHADRAAQVNDLESEVKKYTDDYIIESDIKAALQRASKLANVDDLICVTGSLYTIGEVLAESKNI